MYMLKSREREKERTTEFCVFRAVGPKKLERNLFKYVLKRVSSITNREIQMRTFGWPERAISAQTIPQ